MLGGGQPPLIELEPQIGTALGRRLVVLESGGERAVFLGGTAIHVYDAQDRAAEAAAIALLVRGGIATRVALARAFGCHRNTVWRLDQRFVQAGMAGVVPAKRGPKGPHKVTPEVQRVIAELSDRPCGEVTQAIEERTRVRLTVAYVSHLLKRARAEASQQDVLWQEPAPEAAPEPEAPAPVVAAAPEVHEPVEPPALVPQQARGRYLGAALYYPALEALGLLGAAASCFQLPGAERFGVRAVALTLFFLTLLSHTTVEAAKHLRRWEFGPLVGSGRAPAVKTLRRKLGDLVKQGQASRFGELLARRWVEGGLVATAYLYVDGHMKVYTGKRKLAEYWNAQRRMPLPGQETYFVGDQQGRPLLFVTDEVDGSLAKAMRQVVPAIRKVVGERSFTVVFDRGGYDGKLFAWLREERIDFITYQKGQVQLPVEQFSHRESRFEGRPVGLQLAEDEVKVGDSGPWRRIVVRTKSGHQTPILTSLAALPAAKIACLMFARWRQENFFKYSREHHGLDQLLGYAWAEADGAQLVPNPERKRLDREIKEGRQELAQRRAQLGQAVLAEPAGDGGSTSTAAGLSVTQQEVAEQVRALEGELATLLARRAELPTHVPLSQAGQREVLRLEQKAIIDRIKITAYNAEEWLLDLLVRHYPNPHDVRALLRSFAELSGELRTTCDGVLVTLDPPDTPLHRRALRDLCADLNQLGATFPGTHLPVRYGVAVHHSEVAA